MTPDIGLMVCRFVHDASIMLLWGGYGYLWTLVPTRFADEISDRLRLFRVATISLAITTTAVALPLLSATIGDGWSAALDGETLWGVIASTSVGRAWLFQAAAALILTTAQIVWAKQRLATTTIASGLVLASLALTGHAVMQGGLEGVVHPLNDILHLLSAGAWFGALPVLLIVLSQFDKSVARGEALIALRRFSTAGHVAVALAILTGIANSLFILGWPVSLSTYSLMLAGKVIAVLAMTAIAIINRYCFVPRLGRHRESALRAVRVGTFAEISLGVVAILLVSVFGMLDPAG